MAGRRLMLFTAAALAAGTRRGAAQVAEGAPPGLEEAHRRLAALPDTISYLLQVDDPRGAWGGGIAPGRPLFVGSAFKTFVLAAYLRGVEAGRLSLDEQLAIDDSVRSLSSPVSHHLTGTMPARSVLEAMIAHSDNTATDAAMRKVGAATVRALVEEAGLRQTRIPTSTRRLFSWLAGAPAGTDLDWAGMQAMVAGRTPITPRPAVNDGESILSSAADLVAWYRPALSGGFFTRPETLTEFKRIQAMADAMSMIAPADTAAYGKGGSIEWDGFNCLCAAGQIVVRGVPATFCFTRNWNGPPESVAPATAALLVACRGMLEAVRQRIG
ncbi:serine hydrolase [Roseomonas hellenica]|uniref:Serine hydrolase n=1 Tax=Plastoroseomonas hellenica TaxID=2687306 RepID=A0ABS5F4W3_9PROT|nr:serine hydrolase [Plastoroseomonas hellenica]MBR0667626.1 serine hydrolase [Plastoroseomonas hellenica]